MSASQPSPPAFDNSLGALFLGYSVSAILFGCIIVQTFYYITSKRWKDDSRWLKALVYSLFILDTAHQTFLTAGMYQNLISDFANPLALHEKGPSSGESFATYYEAIPAALCIVLVQLFYAWRIWRFSTSSIGRWRWVVGGLTVGTHEPITISPSHDSIDPQVLLSLLQLGSSIQVVVAGFRHHLFEGNTSDFIRSFKLSTASGVACDLFITACMVLSLMMSRSKIKRSDEVIKYLIILTVNTGALTTILSIASLVTFLTIPRATIYGGFGYVLPKSYIVSFLAIMNSRDFLRGKIKLNDDSVELRTISLPRFARSTDQVITPLHLHLTLLTRLPQDYRADGVQWLYLWARHPKSFVVLRLPSRRPRKEQQGM